MFSKIRSKSGLNNNPYVVQFESGLKPLLVKSFIAASPNGNSIVLEAVAEKSLLLIRSFFSSQSNTREPPKKVMKIFDNFFSDDSISLDLPKEVTDVTEYKFRITRISSVLAKLNLRPF